MKYLDEFSDPELAGKLLDQIRALATRRWAIMEVCGGQTHSIIRHGIDQLLPQQIEMIHGRMPGLCHPARDHRQSSRHRGKTRCHFLLLRGHVASSGEFVGSVPHQERRR